MSQTRANPRYLFPASGWKCFQCCISDGDAPTEFWEVPVLGWGVVEGYDCDEYNPDGTDLQLLVALQDAPLAAPMIYPSSELHVVLTNAAFGFCFNSELTDEDKKTLEDKARANTRFKLRRREAVTA